MKKSIKLLTVLLTAFGFTTNVFAKASVSIGTNFGSGNVNSAGEATTAYNYTSSMGYTAYLQTVPTISNVASLASTFSSSGANGALFYLGHANSSRIIWNYNGNTSSNYKVGITRYGSMCSMDGYDLLSISAWGLSNAKLGVYMGCESAKDTTNIASEAYAGGAKATLGWKKSIYDGDTDTWVSRFYYRLSNGYTIAQSRNYANSYTGYIDSSSITDIRSYGATSNTMNVLTPEVMSIKDNTVHTISVGTELKEADLVSYIKKYNKDFNEKDYVVEHITNDDGDIYNYNLVINGIKTTIGYTITNSENKIELIDNMAGKASKINELKQVVAKKDLRNFDKEAAIEEALNRHKVDHKEMSIKLRDTHVRYNVEKGRIEFVVAIDYYDSQLDVKSIFTETFEM